MNFTVNTFIGVITALSGIIIAVITSWVARRRDSEGVITSREQQVSAEVWNIIKELKQSIQEMDERNERLTAKVDQLEEELRVSKMKEFSLTQENVRLSSRIHDLELMLGIQTKG